MFFFLKSTFGVLFESGSTSPLLLFRSPLVIVGFEVCIRTPFVLIRLGCSGTQYDPIFLPNRSDVLPVNMRCTRAAVGQYEVACRGVWTRLKSVRFFC